MMKAKAVFCHAKPWLLDTAAKVKWANSFRLAFAVPLRWGLGDHCYYRPSAP